MHKEGIKNIAKIGVLAGAVALVGCGEKANLEKVQPTPVASSGQPEDDVLSPTTVTTLGEKVDLTQPSTTTTTVRNLGTETNPRTTTTRKTTATESNPVIESKTAFGNLAEDVSKERLEAVRDRDLMRAKPTENTPSIDEMTDKFNKINTESQYRGKPYSMEFMIERVAKFFFERLSTNGSYGILIGGQEANGIYKGDIANFVVDKATGNAYVFLTDSDGGNPAVFFLDEKTILDSSLLKDSSTNSVLGLAKDGKFLDLLGDRNNAGRIDDLVVGIQLQPDGTQVSNSQGYLVAGSLVFSGS
ncbi:hypothetical protein M1349_00990 [Patescibacteria group bacterium]|nr:hypothetical protein [Patescibacteria group bacterium]